MTIHRIPFTITISDDLWGGRTLVSVHPRQIDKPSRSFQHAEAAVAYAEDLAKTTGWQVFDTRGEPPRAA